MRIEEFKKNKRAERAGRSGWSWLAGPVVANVFMGQLLEM